jgi:hypothetical protein
VVAGNIVTAGLVSVAGNVNAGNIVTVDMNLTGNITGAANVTGNVRSGNVTTVGLISAAGNITGGNIRSLGIISTTGTIINSDIDTSGNITADGYISAVGNVVAGNIVTAGSVLSSGTAGVGYVTGAGGVVTQLTSKTTAVTLNKISGEITSNNASIPGDTVVSFALNNSTIANTDVMIINQVSVANIGLYNFIANCQTGYANIHIHNVTNSAKADVIVIRYAVIKGAVS